MSQKNGRRPDREELELNQILRNAELAHVAEEAKIAGDVQLENEATVLLKSGCATTDQVVQMQIRLHDLVTV